MDNQIAGVFNNKNMNEQCQLPILLDTGTHLSVMYKSCFLALGYDIQDLQQCRHNVITVLGKFIDILGGVYINFQIAGIEISHYFHILPDAEDNPSPVSLGIDFFEAIGPSLDLQKKRFYIGHNWTHFGPPKKPYSGLVRTIQDIYLTPLQVVDFVCGKLNHSEDIPSNDTVLLIDPLSENSKDLCIVPTVCKILRDNMVIFRIRNTNCHRSLHLLKNAIIAKASTPGKTDTVNRKSIFSSVRRGHQWSPSLSTINEEELIPEPEVGYADISNDTTSEISKKNDTLYTVSKIIVDWDIIPEGKKDIVDTLLRNHDGIFGQNQSDPPQSFDTIFNRLGGMKYFSSLNMKEGYWQIPTVPPDRHLTLPETSNELYESNVMSLDSINASTTFQHCMNNLLHDLIAHGVFAYSDNILVYTKTFEEHTKLLMEIFKRLDNVNMKLNAPKCQILRKEVEYVCHTISAEGMRPNDNLIESIEKMEPPKTIMENKKFLGMLSLLRHYIPDFATISEPLNKLNRGIDSSHIGLHWGSQQQEAFDKLRHFVSSRLIPILVFPDNTKPFLLFCEVSNYGIFGVLCQIRNEEFLHPISFASRTLTKVERVWSKTDIQCLAIVWLSEHFRPFIHGHTVRIFTNHEPMEVSWSKNIVKVQERLAQWGLIMSQYNFTIEHLPRTDNMMADYWKQNPCYWAMTYCVTQDKVIPLLPGTSIPDNSCNLLLDPMIHRRPNQKIIGPISKFSNSQFQDWYKDMLNDSVSGLLLANGCCLTCDTLHHFWQEKDSTYNSTMTTIELDSTQSHGRPPEVSKPEYHYSNDPDNFYKVQTETQTIGVINDRFYEFYDQIGEFSLNIVDISCRSFQHLQRDDPEICNVITLLQQSEHRLDIHLPKSYSRFQLIDDCLYLKPQAQHGFRLCIPHDLILRTLDLFHDHKFVSPDLQYRHMYYCISQYYYWPTMSNDINDYIQGCSICRNPQICEDSTIQLMYPKPWKILVLEIFGPLPPSSTGNKYALIFTDLFSGFSIAQAVPEITTMKIITILEEHVILNFGTPEELIFTSEELIFTNSSKLPWEPLEDFCLHNDIHLHTETPTSVLPHPLYQVLSILFRSYLSTRQNDWDDYLQCAVFMLRLYLNPTMEKIPPTAPLIRDSFLPIHVMYDLKPPLLDGSTYCTSKMKPHIRFAQEELTQLVKGIIIVPSKRQFDSEWKPPEFQPGDIVWIFNPHTRFNDSKKLHLPWQGPYRIVDTNGHFVYLRDCYYPTRHLTLRHINHLRRWYPPVLIPDGGSCQLDDVPRYVLPTVPPGISFVDPVAELWPALTIHPTISHGLQTPQSCSTTLDQLYVGSLLTPSLQSQLKIPWKVISQISEELDLHDEVLESIPAIFASDFSLLDVSISLTQFVTPEPKPPDPVSPTLTPEFPQPSNPDEDLPELALQMPCGGCIFHPHVEERSILEDVPDTMLPNLSNEPKVKETLTAEPSLDDLSPEDLLARVRDLDTQLRKQLADIRRSREFAKQKKHISPNTSNDYCSIDESSPPETDIWTKRLRGPILPKPVKLVEPPWVSTPVLDPPVVTTSVSIQKSDAERKEFSDETNGDDTSMDAFMKRLRAKVLKHRQNSPTPVRPPDPVPLSEPVTNPNVYRTPKELAEVQSPEKLQPKSQSKPRVESVSQSAPPMSPDAEIRGVTFKGVFRNPEIDPHTKPYSHTGTWFFEHFLHIPKHSSYWLMDVNRRRHDLLEEFLTSNSNVTNRVFRFGIETKDYINIFYELTSYIDKERFNKWKEEFLQISTQPCYESHPYLRPVVVC